jgi:ABC-type arginine transport system ATPase subunit
MKRGLGFALLTLVALGVGVGQLGGCSPCGPLAGAAILLLGGRRTDRWGPLLGVATVLGSFALAMALSHGADLLIMDEPTAGLDPIFRRDLLRRLSALLQEEGKSILFSTHITTDLERVADVITYIHGGELVI